MRWSLWMLGVSGFALIFATGLFVPAALWFILWLYIVVRKTPVQLRKWWVYGAVLPFALWFLIAPAAGAPKVAGISAWLFWIAGWYFQGLGTVQQLSLGRGGETRFVWWNSFVALGLAACSLTPVLQPCLVLWMVLWLLDVRGASILSNALRPKIFLTWIVALALTAGIWLAYDHWQDDLWNFHMQHSHWGGDHSQMKGFEPSSWLGSFSEEYGSPWDGQIALRVYSPAKPEYMRGMVQATYSFGIWHATPLDTLWRSQGNYVEYSRFDFASTDTTALRIWVQPVLPTFGCLFTQLGHQGLAVMADSLYASKEGVLKSSEASVQHGYYLGAHTVVDARRSEHDLAVPAVLNGMLDSAWNQADSTRSVQTSAEKMVALSRWFQSKYTYDLQPKMEHHADPLRTFVQARRGYCEYFATLATLMLRRAQVPTRYVIGFAHPEREGDAWVFRRANAHAWVEVFLGEQGWVTFDPTPVSFIHAAPVTPAWQMVSERITAKIHLWQHALLDGPWKLAVDRFGVWSAQLLHTTSLWLTLGLLALLLLLWKLRMRSRLRIRHSTTSQHHWITLLDSAEKRLMHQGYARVAGETIHAWLQRMPADADAQAVQQLEKYQAMRFRKPA